MISSKFNLLACRCHLYGDGEDCCHGDNAHISLQRARSDSSFLYSICELTQSAIENALEPEPTSSPSGILPTQRPSVTFVPSSSPTMHPTTPKPTVYIPKPRPKSCHGSEVPAVSLVFWMFWKKEDRADFRDDCIQRTFKGPFGGLIRKRKPPIMKNTTDTVVHFAGLGLHGAN